MIGAAFLRSGRRSPIGRLRGAGNRLEGLLSPAQVPGQLVALALLPFDPLAGRVAALTRPVLLLMGHAEGLLMLRPAREQLIELGSAFPGVGTGFEPFRRFFQLVA